MPIFARTKLMMEDHCMTYRPIMFFTYSGPNPHKIYPKIIDIVMTTLAVPKENIQEKEFNWDKSKPEEKFKITLEVIKDYDKFSYMLLFITVSGTAKPSKDFEKEGEAKVEMDGVLRTEYPQDTMWERSFIYEIFRVFYHKVFYHEERKRYLDACRDSMMTFQGEIKSFFNLLPKMV
ncbi:MAG TPA: hypothetical protein VJ343_00375 [archaeon]|nr:hypothetical protein [archaeon]